MRRWRLVLKAVPLMLSVSPCAKQKDATISPCELGAVLDVDHSKLMRN